MKLLKFSRDRQLSLPYLADNGQSLEKLKIITNYTEEVF